MSVDHQFVIPFMEELGVWTIPIAGTWGAEQTKSPDGERRELSTQARAFQSDGSTSTDPEDQPARE